MLVLRDPLSIMTFREVSLPGQDGDVMIV